jgi:peptide/nickel transport system substrate-binding protein
VAPEVAGGDASHLGARHGGQTTRTGGPMSKAYDRRSFLSQGVRTAAGVAVLGGGASSVLAACGSSSPTASTSSSSAGIGSGTPKQGGSIVVGLESEFNGFDPTQGRWDPAGVMYGRTVYDPLCAVAADGSTKPYLAQSVNPNSDYTKWTITMRPNITFHNGTPLDAQAVKVNLDALRQAGLTGPAFANVSSVDVTGPLTLVVSMKSPWVPFPSLINGQYQAGYIAEPSTILNGTAATHPVGTGPWVFQTWVPNAHFTATRNPHYWRQGLPYLDTVTFKPIPDAQSRENALKAGDIDMMHTSTVQNYVDLHNDSSFVTITDLHSTIEPDMNFVMLNTDQSPANDVRVRQALAYATNIQQYINVIDNGVPPPATGPFVPGSPYYGSTGYPSFNLSKAQQLVREYQQQNGAVNLPFQTTNDSSALRGAQLLQQMWSAAGIHTTINQTEQTTLIANALSGKYTATSWRQFAASDPDLNYIWWTIANASPIGQSALNFARNKDPQVQKAIDTGRASSDQTTRAQAYQTAAKRFAVDVPYVWLDRAVWTVSAKPNVQNFAGATLPGGTKVVPLIFGEWWLTQTWRS